MNKKDIELKLLEEVENRVIKPYEGHLKTDKKCCQELHGNITDNIRGWFNKLRNEVRIR